MLRPDNISSTTGLPNYINIGNPTGNILILGTLADSTTQDFAVSIPTSVRNTRCDIYGTNLATQDKQLLSTSNYIAIYQPISTEFTQLATSQTSGNVTITITVNNFTGSPITLITQTIKIDVVEYEIPF